MWCDLHVPFNERDEAKRLGAQWDPIRKIWYVMDKDLKYFHRWISNKERKLVKRRGGLKIIGPTKTRKVFRKN